MQTVVYQGRVVSKDGFRTFIYNSSGEQKLVNSWNEYESLMSTSLWFSTREEIQAEEVKSKKKSKKEHFKTTAGE